MIEFATLLNINFAIRLTISDKKKKKKGQFSIPTGHICDALKWDTRSKNHVLGGVETKSCIRSGVKELQEEALILTFNHTQAQCEGPAFMAVIMRTNQEPRIGQPDTDYKNGCQQHTRYHRGWPLSVVQ